ncbi:MAG: hypothetical protein MZV64_33920 [Ignavibacteriales bacterium]|nr:hypothetical protein [Ignavibacteriales bacterium]
MFRKSVLWLVILFAALTLAGPGARAQHARAVVQGHDGFAGGPDRGPHQVPDRGR